MIDFSGGQEIVGDHAIARATFDGCAARMLCGLHVMVAARNRPSFGGRCHSLGGDDGGQGGFPNSFPSRGARNSGRFGMEKACLDVARGDAVQKTQTGGGQEDVDQADEVAPKALFVHGSRRTSGGGYTKKRAARVGVVRLILSLQCSAGAPW